MQRLPEEGQRKKSSDQGNNPNKSSIMKIISFMSTLSIQSHSAPTIQYIFKAINFCKR